MSIISFVTLKQWFIAPLLAIHIMDDSINLHIGWLCGILIIEFKRK